MKTLCTKNFFLLDVKNPHLFELNSQGFAQNIDLIENFVFTEKLYLKPLFC